MDAEDPDSRPRRRPSRASALRLRVAVVDRHGARLSAGGLGPWLTKVAPRRARGILSVALVSDAQIRKLNQRYRGKDYATDVLSFPASAEPHSAALPSRLGDIVIGTGVTRRQARSAGHSVATELRVLALHGLLHLIGYDHETDDGAMERVERRLRKKGGLRVGLIDRAARGAKRRADE